MLALTPAVSPNESSEPSTSTQIGPERMAYVDDMPNDVMRAILSDDSEANDSVLNFVDDDHTPVIPIPLVDAPPPANINAPNSDVAPPTVMVAEPQSLIPDVVATTTGWKRTNQLLAEVRNQLPSMARRAVETTNKQHNQRNDRAYNKGVEHRRTTAALNLGQSVVTPM